MSTHPPLFKLFERTSPHQGALCGITVQDDDVIISGGQGYSLLYQGPIDALNQCIGEPGRGLRGSCLRGEELWTVGEHGHIARSLDGGASWEKINSPAKDQCLYSIVLDAEGRLWTGGDNGLLMMCPKGSHKFTSIKGIKVEVCDMFASELGVLIPTNRPGNLYITKGKTLHKTSLETGVDMMTALHTQEGSLIVVGSQGTIFRSTDQGESFEQVESGLPGATFSVVQTMRDGRVVVAGSKGAVLISSDDGASFEHITHDLSQVDIYGGAPYHNAMLLCGGKGTVFCLDMPERDEVEVVTDISELKAYPAQTTVYPEGWEGEFPAHWDVPKINEATQSWKPPALTQELHRGMHVSDRFRALLIPRRGGVHGHVRPLPTEQEAWSEFQRKMWEYEHSLHLHKPGTTPQVWKFSASSDTLHQSLGARLLDPLPGQGTEQENVLLFDTFAGKGMSKYSTPRELTYALADVLVTQIGLFDTIKIAFAQLRELPYAHTGIFQRLRELLTLCDDPTYAQAQQLIEACYRTKLDELNADRGSKTYLANVGWAATFLLPLDISGTPTEIERRVHDEAMEYLCKFGDLEIHAAYLASGDRHTLERSLKVNGGGSREFYFPGPSSYMASIIELEGDGCVELMASWAPQNNLWCEMLAHIRHERALKALVHQHETLGESDSSGMHGLLTAAALDPDYLFEYLESQSKHALRDELRARINRPRFDVSPPTMSSTTITTYAYRPGAPTQIDVIEGIEAHAPEPVIHLTHEEIEQQLERAAYGSRVEFKGRIIHELDRADLEEYVAYCLKWSIKCDAAELLVLPDDLHEARLTPGVKVPSYWDFFPVKSLLRRKGMHYMDFMLAALSSKNDIESALGAGVACGDARVLPAMARAFAGKKHKDVATQWIKRYPAHAAAGAVALLSRDSDHAEAARVLTYLDRCNMRDIVEQQAHTAGISPIIKEILERDPLTPKLRKKQKLPTYADAATLPTLTLSSTGKPSSPDETLEELRRLAFSNAEEPHPEVLRAKKRYTLESRTEFVWALFEAWIADGAPAKQQWCLQALGFWGDDDTVDKLTRLAMKWPGEGAGKRAQWALAALANIGTEFALTRINLLSEKSKFPAFKGAAATYIKRVAQDRGLTRDALADRLAPRLGLSDEGVEELDFGPRTFFVKFDESLMPIVFDSGHTRLKKLPKANASDDAVLAKAAHKRFKDIKKEAKASASLQTLRAELAMGTQRQISTQVFQECFVQHPWMTHLTQRLVWHTIDAKGAVGTGFRVSPEQQWFDVEDEHQPNLLKGVTHVVVAHPLHLSEEHKSAWMAIFADDELIQPFSQLDRDTYKVENAKSSTSARFVGKELSHYKLLKLEKGRWYRVVDNAITGFSKEIERGLSLVIELDGDEGWYPYMNAEDIPMQVLSELYIEGRKGLTFGELDPVIFSEAARDIEQLLK